MRIAIIMSLLALAACSDKQPEQKVEPAVTLQAGLWEMGSQVTQVLTPGAPLQVMKEPKVSAYCLKPADADKPQPAMFAEAKGSCSFENDHMSDGRMVLTFTCKQGNITSKDPLAAASTTTSIEGSYTATTIEANVDLSVYGAGQRGYLAKAKLTGKRVGECPAEPSKS
jgi:hypothetical protein